MPIFKPELIEKILTGEKTQTRRPRKEGDAGWVKYVVEGEYLAVGRNGRRLWQFGHDYAIVPGRGKPAIEGARIRITRIRQEDVRDISDADVLAEGFTNKWEFFQVWTDFYDRHGSNKALSDAVAANNGMVEEPVLMAALKARPDALYQAWALTFELVTP